MSWNQLLLCPQTKIQQNQFILIGFFKSRNIPRNEKLSKSRFTRRLFNVLFWRLFEFWGFSHWIVKELGLMDFCFEIWNSGRLCTSCHLQERCCSGKKCFCGLFHFFGFKKLNSFVYSHETAVVGYRRFVSSKWYDICRIILMITFQNVWSYLVW